MKKLSNELLKTYVLLISMFLALLLVAYIQSAYSLFKESKEEVRNVEKFLEEQLKSPRHGNIDLLFHGIIDESPKVDDIYIILKSNNKTSSTSGIQNIEMSSKDHIFNYHFKSGEIITSSGETIEYSIIKKLKYEKEFLLKKLKTYLIGSFFVIILGFFISRNSYRKIVPQLKDIENISDKVNLNSFEVDISKDKFFMEFSSILRSYENMLNRLKKQTNAEIDFVHNASHELKTPIFIIRGYVNLIKRWGINNKEVSLEALDSINSEVQSMGVLIEKLLFLAKQDKIPLEIEEFQLGELIAEVVYEMNIIYPQQTFNLNIETTSLLSDQGLIKQLIRNIIDNAIKYGNKKSIDISLTSDEFFVNLVVEDRGRGLTTNELEQVFDKFFRSDSARTLKGHGLGLSIVKQILNLLEGEIRITSENKAGCKVSIKIPKKI